MAEDYDIKPPTLRQAGDPREGTATWTIIGNPKPGHCSQCFVEHEPWMPHDCTSLQYQYRFNAEHGRWPTWEDAMAHCTDEVYEITRKTLAEHGIEVAAR